METLLTHFTKVIILLRMLFGRFVLCEKPFCVVFVRINFHFRRLQVVSAFPRRRGRFFLSVFSVGRFLFFCFLFCFSVIRNGPRSPRGHERITYYPFKTRARFFIPNTCYRVKDNPSEMGREGGAVKKINTSFYTVR